MPSYSFDLEWWLRVSNLVLPAKLDEMTIRSFQLGWQIARTEEVQLFAKEHPQHAAWLFKCVQRHTHTHSGKHTPAPTPTS